MSLTCTSLWCCKAPSMSLKLKFVHGQASAEHRAGVFLVHLLPTYHSVERIGMRNTWHPKNLCAEMRCGEFSVLHSSTSDTLADHGRIDKQRLQESDTLLRHFKDIKPDEMMSGLCDFNNHSWLEEVC